MFGLPDFLTNPGGRFWQGIGAISSNRQQDRAQRNYNRLQDQQIAQSLGYASRVGPQQLNTYDSSAGQQLGSIRDLRASQQAGANRLQRMQAMQLANRTRGVMGDYNQGAQGYEQGLGQFQNQFANDSNTLNQGYQDRYNTAAQDLQNYGEQQKADINKQFDQQKAAAVNNLNERGWANSTVIPGVTSQVEEARSAELRRLGDDLTRQRVGILSGLSGEQLASQGGRFSEGSGYGFTGMGNVLQNNLGRANLRAGLTGDEANSAQNLGLFGLQNDAAMGNNEANFWGQNAANRSNIVGNGMNTYLNTLTGINYVPPPSNQGVMNQFGQNMVQGPQDQSHWYSSLIGAAAPAVGAATGGWLGGLGGAAGGGGGGSLADALPPNGVGQPGSSFTGPPAYKRRTPIQQLAATPRRGGYQTTKRMIGQR